MSVTHITGPVLNIRGRGIQRCSLCGEKLLDSKGMSAPIEPDGSEPRFLTWEVGRLLRVEGENPRCSTLLDATDLLPDDSCLDLIED